MSPKGLLTIRASKLTISVDHVQRNEKLEAREYHWTEVEPKEDVDQSEEPVKEHLEVIPAFTIADVDLGRDCDLFNFRVSWVRFGFDVFVIIRNLIGLLVFKLKLFEKSERREFG